MKLYLDDVRHPSYNYSDPEDWTIVRTAEEAMQLLATNEVTEISFLAVQEHPAYLALPEI